MSFSYPETRHQPVLVQEVLALLEPKVGHVIVDGTLGSGGHAAEILKRIGTKGRLIGMDQDPEAIERAQANLKAFQNVEIMQANFSQIPQILHTLNVKAVNAVLLDVGVSSEQLEEARRGFSFLKEGPLDMRMDLGQKLQAKDLVNELSEAELEKLFRVYGEERWARRIAKTITRERSRKPVETTAELVRIVAKAVPRPFHFGPRHPAMRVFQALRIRVNEELQNLEEALPEALQVLKPRGRLAVISFHSLEDRLVKHSFRAWADAGKVKVLTRKPVTASEEEICQNPRSRSAKLRAIEKIGE